MSSTVRLVRSAVGIRCTPWRLAAALACVVAGALGGAAAAAARPTTYESSSRVYVNAAAPVTAAQAVQGVQLATQLLETIARLGTTRAARGRAAAVLAADGVPAGSASGTTTVRPVPDSLLLEVRAEASTPRAAQALAAATTTVVVQVVTDLESGATTAVAATVIDAAELPSGPAPRPVLEDTALGALVGLAGAAALVLVLDAGEPSGPADPADPDDPNAVADPASRTSARSGTWPPVAHSTPAGDPGACAPTAQGDAVVVVPTS